MSLFYRLILSVVLVLFGAQAMAKIQVSLAPSLLKDSSGLLYIGYVVPKTLIAPQLKQLKQHVGKPQFELLRENQAKRDHHSFHITLINPYEYPNVESIDIKSLPVVRFEFVGLGHRADKNNQTYFVVVKAKKAQKAREQYGLKAKDFHVTLGFNKQDVFGVSKGVDSLL